MANETARDFKANTDYAANTGHAEIEELRRQIKDLTDTLGRSVRQNAGEVEQQIRDKPVQATLVAAGIGFLLGALFSR
jgi:ElaB/YqjD/DUF883 family membrane-anchored ribosome-binding protein